MPVTLSLPAPSTLTPLTPLTPVQRIPSVKDSLESAFLTHGYQQEEMHAEYMRVRREALAKVDEDLTDTEATSDIKDFLSSDPIRRKAAMDLALNSQSPIVSKETQIAILKSLVQDFMKGKKRAGLSALTALKAVELLNRLCGYDAPIKQNVEVNHKVTCLPVIQAPFRGELPILRVVDIGNDDGSVTSVAMGDAPSSLSPESDDAPGVSPETDKDLQLF